MGSAFSTVRNILSKKASYWRNSTILNSQNKFKVGWQMDFDWKSHYCNWPNPLISQPDALTIKIHRLFGISLDTWPKAMCGQQSVVGSHYFCDKNDCLLCPNWRQESKSLLTKKIRKAGHGLAPENPWMFFIIKNRYPFLQLVKITLTW